MMRKILLALAIVLGMFPAYSEIVIEKTNGETVIPSDTSVSNDANGNYTIGGVPVTVIEKVYNNPLAQVPMGEKVVLGAEKVKPVAVLDMNGRNNVVEASDDGRYLYSAEYMVQIAGLPYFVTESLDEAMEGSSMMLLAGCILKKTFTDDEFESMIEWVKEGGILISPAIEYKPTGKCLELFGIDGLTPKLKTHSIIKWADKGDEELVYIDTDEERNTYIGENYIFTTIYSAAGADVLATYDDTDDAAVIRHRLGKGCVYSVGVRWRDVIQRTQLNKSGSNRVKNNHFEASGDVYPLFVRACYVANNPVTVWKHTIPDGYESVLIPTHDCDSRTAMQEMHWISEYEHSMGLNAHFFLTTHYFRQPSYLSAFYDDDAVAAAKDLLALGHTVGSHSVCHFPDFSKTERFPMTVTTPEEYAETCTFDVENKVASGGSTWAEVVMSKQILERDLGNKVRSFRSGHLCVNGNIPEALVVGEYSFASTYTATDLWCSFPFFQRMEVKWSGELSNVLQMPLHYSDVKPTGVTMTADEIEGTMPVWMDYHRKLKGNFAPNILLIHPNSEWKMQAEKRFVDLLDLATVGLYNFEDYGDFWIKRLELGYDYEYADSELRIVVDAPSLEPYKGQGLFIEARGPVKRIAVADRNGNAAQVRVVKVAAGRYIAVI